METLKEMNVNLKNIAVTFALAVALPVMGQSAPATPTAQTPAPQENPQQQKIQKQATNIIKDIDEAYDRIATYKRIDQDKQQLQQLSQQYQQAATTSAPVIPAAPAAAPAKK